MPALPHLVPIGPELEHLFLDLAREYAAAGEDRYRAPLADFPAFLREVARFAAGSDLPPDRVPQDFFCLLAGDRLLGCSRLRHRLIPALELDGGSIGYDIRPSARGCGHGREILRLSLREADRIGIDRALLTCEEANVASRRVIEANGGRPDGSCISPNTGATMLRYWIDVRALSGRCPSLS